MTYSGLIAFCRSAIGLLFGLLCVLLAGTHAIASPQVIVPGAVWLDDQGEPIQAHGGGVIQVGDTFYWYGEDRSATIPRGIRCVSGYSSKDLVHWSHLGQVLRSANRIIERPKVFYNDKTKTWVMYVHFDGPLPSQDGDYSLASVGVFVSSNPAGPFQMIGMFRPLGHESRDIGQFIDDDGSAYLIFEDRLNGFHIAKLTGDYLGIERDACLIPEHLEGGVLVHFGDMYYVAGSHLTSWSPNPNVYATAKTLAGPWSAFQNIAPPETNTYGSQSSMMLKIKGSKQTVVIYMADQWRPNNLSDSRYLWMPLTIGGGALHLPPPRPWTIDVATGEVSFDVSEQQVREAQERNTSRSLDGSVSLSATASATSFQSGSEPSKAVDGNPSTFWHSKFWPDKAQLPQSITLDLGSKHVVTKLQYLPRQDDVRNGTITKYNVYVSSDGTTFGNPVVSGYWSGDDSLKTTALPKVRARYVRLEAVEAVDGYCTAAEVTVFGAAAVLP